MRTVRNKDDLAQAVEQKEDTIVIEGDLAKKVIKIKATGKVAWAVAIGGITVAVLAILAAPETAGTSTAVTVAAFAPTAAAVGGADVALTAIGIAVAAGGVGVLNQLRSYDIVEKQSNRVVLKR